MFFKNAIFFTFPLELAQSLRNQVAGEPESLQALLEAGALKPVGPLELTSRGFIPPLGEDRPALYHAIGNYLWLSIGTEARMLPSSVINRELQKKLEQIEKTEGRKPGGRARKRLKDDLVQELLPKAFVQPGRTDAYLDLERGLLVVDTSSRKTAENVASQIRGALGSFPGVPLNAEVAPRSVLTGWIAGEPMPEGLSLGEECEMKDPIEGGAVVKCQHQELRCEEIDKNLEAGKQVTKLALTLDDHVSFVLGEDLVIRKLKFLDGAMDSLESSDAAGADAAVAELDARFVLLTGEIAGVFDVLKVAFKFSDNATAS